MNLIHNVGGDSYKLGTGITFLGKTREPEALRGRQTQEPTNQKAFVG